MKLRLLVSITTIFAVTGLIYGQADVVLLAPAPLAIQEIAVRGVVDWNPTNNTLATFITNEGLGTLPHITGDNRSIEIWSPIESSPLPQANMQLSATEVSGDMLAYSPDGTRLATLSPASLSIIDAASGRLIVQRAGAPAYFLAWSPDSTRVAIPSTTDFYALDLVDALNGITLQTYRFFEDAETFAGASLRDATWGSSTEIAVIGTGNRSALLNLETGAITNISDCCGEGSYQLEWQPMGHLLATHDRVYDINARQPLFDFPQQNNAFWSPDGRWVLGTTLNEASLISLAEQRIVLRFSVERLGEGHTIAGADWSMDGNYIALVTTTLTVNSSAPVYQSFASVWDMQAISAQAGITLNP